jgi:hypothetical protein
MVLKKQQLRDASAILLRKLRTTWIRYNPLALRNRIWFWFIEADTYLRDRMNRRHYHIITPDEFRQRRTTPVIFIFGSGASLRDIPAEEWARIDRYETIGWRLFALQAYVHADFLLVREVGQVAHMLNTRAQKRDSEALANWIRQNDRLRETIIIVQAGWKAVAGNRFLGGRFAPSEHTYMRFRNGRRQSGALPAETFAEGITHGQGTLTDAMNIAYLGGWKHIVLIGVDLYNSAYFNVAPEAPNPDWVYADSGPEQPHLTAQSGIVETVGAWAQWMSERGVQVSVYNPKSLLAEVIPVFRWDMIE